MKILALETENPGAAESAFTPSLLAQEARCVWDLEQRGIIREIYFRADRNLAVVVLESPSAEDAHRILGSLPLVQAGLIRFEVIPLRPYPGLGRLFTGR